jgi:hypothetical protein
VTSQPPGPGGLTGRMLRIGPDLWIGGLFAVGSFCFALGSLPSYFDNVAARVVAVTFFVGSIFFTSAAYLQYRHTPGTPSEPVPAPAHRRRVARLVGWTPRPRGWWASAVQLVGTVFFNLTTFAAILSNLDLEQDRRLIWAPDVFGSACFLVASWLAYTEVCPRLWRWRDRSLAWWISALNLLGSVAFGVAAVASRYLISTGDPANLALVNLGTFVGAVCFLVGGVLLPLDSAGDTTPAETPTTPAI